MIYKIPKKMFPYLKMKLEMPISEEIFKAELDTDKKIVTTISNWLGLHVSCPRQMTEKQCNEILERLIRSKKQFINNRDKI